MRNRHRAVVEVVLAFAAGAGCVASFLAARSPVTIPPLRDGEPSVPSVTYYPPLLLLALVLGTLAGVLVVVGIARWRRPGVRSGSTG